MARGALDVYSSMVRRWTQRLFAWPLVANWAGTRSGANCTKSATRANRSFFADADAATASACARPVRSCVADREQVIAKSYLSIFREQRLALLRKDCSGCEWPVR